MRTVYNVPFDVMVRELLDLGTIAMKSPLWKDIEKMCNCGDECKCEESECKCEDTCTPPEGVLKSHSNALSDKFVVIVEVPGLSDEDITVEFKEDTLTLKADYGKKTEEDFSKIRVGKWMTAYKFKGVDTEKIVAKLDKGQLTVTLPKKPEAQPFKVEINK
jgi:HSP20 family molecular chaperone IbpA